MYFMPGVSLATAKARAYGLVSRAALSRVEGKTAISSDRGPSVASRRAPLTMRPASVSSTTRRATSSLARPVAVRRRFTCGLTRVCVNTRSLLRIFS